MRYEGFTQQILVAFLLISLMVWSLVNHDFVGMALAAFAVAGLLWMNRAIRGGIRELMDTIEEAANDPTYLEYPIVQEFHKDDPLHGISRTVNQMVQNHLASREKITRENGVEHARQAHIEMLISRFRSDVENNITYVSHLSTDMRSSSCEVGDAAEQAHRYTEDVKSASNNAGAAVHQVSQSAQSLSQSITNISDQTDKAKVLVRKATDMAGVANDKVGELRDHADLVGTTVDLVRDIADRTNLLALNATIEAARAGEAGKGFAVVAAEVKQLSDQTARATEEIRDRIEKIQSSTATTVSSIGEMAEIFQRVYDVTDDIVGVVDTQQTANLDIVNAVTAASDQTQKVDGRLTLLCDAISQTSMQAKKSEEATNVLLSTTEQLGEQLDGFLQDVERDINERRKDFRHRVFGEVIVTFDGETRQMPVIDLSLGGACLKAETTLKRGDPIYISVASDEEPRKATVARNLGQSIGVRFDQSLTDIKDIQLIRNTPEVTQAA